MDLKEEDILGPTIKDHWYYVSKARALRKICGDRPVEEVLDVGAGSGVFSRQRLDWGIAERGVCVDPGYMEEWEECHNGRPLSFVRELDRVTQELILMMDVLEHVDDDLGLLKQYTETMPPAGRVLITVPAFQSLWSGHDVFLEHRRRYRLSEVEDLVRCAGLKVERSCYFFGLLFPVAAAIRLIARRRLAIGDLPPRSSLRPAGPVTNEILIRIHDLERRTLFFANRLAGLSVFCLATPTTYPQ